MELDSKVTSKPTLLTAPKEILLEIFGHVGSSDSKRKTSAALCLVSKAFEPLGKLLLYTIMEVRMTQRNSTKLLRTVVTNPEIGEMIQRIHVSISSPKQFVKEEILDHDMISKTQNKIHNKNAVVHFDSLDKTIFYVLVEMGDSIAFPAMILLHTPNITRLKVSGKFWLWFDDYSFLGWITSFQLRFKLERVYTDHLACEDLIHLLKMQHIKDIKCRLHMDEGMSNRDLHRACDRWDGLSNISKLEVQGTDPRWFDHDAPYTTLSHCGNLEEFMLVVDVGKSDSANPVDCNKLLSSLQSAKDTLRSFALHCTAVVSENSILPIITTFSKLRVLEMPVAALMSRSDIDSALWTLSNTLRKLVFVCTLKQQIWDSMKPDGLMNKFLDSRKTLQTGPSQLQEIGLHGHGISPLLTLTDGSGEKVSDECKLELRTILYQKSLGLGIKLSLHNITFSDSDIYDEKLIWVLGW